MLVLQKHLWDMEKLLFRAGSNYGEPFSTKRGITQGGLLSSLMFNVCVDAVAMEWLYQTLGEKAAHDRLRERVVKILVGFYIDDRLIALCDPVWLQESFDIPIGLICVWTGLFTNATKTKAMVCIPGWIQVPEGKTEEEYDVVK
jgi:hypothetical protein